MDDVVSAIGYLADGSPKCSTGSAATSFSKAGVYKGLKAGDSVVVTYSHCLDKPTSTTLDGVVKLVAIADVQLNKIYSYDLNYHVETAGLSLVDSRGSYQVSGALDVGNNFVLGYNTNTSVVPAGQSFTATVAITGLTPTLVTYGAGTSFKHYIDSGDFLLEQETSELNGSITIGDGQSAATALTIATPTPLALILVNGRTLTLEPVSGVVNTSWGNPVLATSTTVNGANVTVSADGDGNGSLDLVSTMTWDALLGS